MWPTSDFEAVVFIVTVAPASGRPTGAGAACIQPTALGTMAQPPGLTTMDRICLAIIASAVPLHLGAASPYVTKIANLMHHARTVGAFGRNR